MRTAISILVALAASGIVHAGPDSFPYLTWTNKAGNSFEARFDHIAGDKVVLRAKKGGRRYPVKRETLSATSEQLLESYEEQEAKKLKSLQQNAGSAVPVEVAYRAVALGQAGNLTALRHRTINFTIDRIRVKDRLTAILELNGHCFREFKAPEGREFFIKNDHLYTRPSQKDNRIPYPKRTNAEASLLYERGAALMLRIEPGMEVQWDSIGVSEGPVFR